jgi:pimeloyl-ACP methyl ester carboxylesterase
MNEKVPGRSLDVNGAAVYHEDHCDGPPLILIHGRLASSTAWEPIVPELADRLRVITPDSRSHGRSTNPGGEPGITTENRRTR